MAGDEKTLMARLAAELQQRKQQVQGMGGEAAATR